MIRKIIRIDESNVMGAVHVHLPVTKVRSLLRKGRPD